MTHAIITKYHGATNIKPSRISAKCGGKTVYVSYDHALSVVQNHEAAALAWLAKHSFVKPSGKLMCGDSPDGKGYVFMLADAAIIHARGNMVHALGNMLQWAIGNRGSKSDNPYSVPEIKDALNALHEAVTGKHAAVIDGTYDTLDLFKIN